MRYLVSIVLFIGFISVLLKKHSSIYFLFLDICPNEADFVFSGKVRRTNGKNALRHRCFKV